MCHLSAMRRGHEGDSTLEKTVRFLGTHGVPAAYGGFETAAENIGLHLLRAGWRVVVYCQVEGRGPLYSDTWQGLDRINIPVDLPGWRGTGKFDLLSIRHASQFSDVCLTFGYNTAVFNLWQRVKRIPLVINMDGIEWTRKRWGPALQAVLFLNERVACVLADDLIADHPEIESYLRRIAPRSRITMIPYGADAVAEAPTSPLEEYGLVPGRYLTLIARSIPENSILELVRGFSVSRRGVRLVVLGRYEPSVDPYHRAVLDAASDEVDFLGPIYEPAVTSSLRFHSALYLHGHTIGGTNPSLVEAMSAGNPVLAYDNPYNRWVAGEAAVYFADETDVARHLDRLIGDGVPDEGSRAPDGELARMSAASRERHHAEFTWERIAASYEALLAKHVTDERAVGSTS